MSWSTMGATEWCRWANIREGVTAGDLFWLTSDPGTGVGPTDQWFTRANYDAYLTVGPEWPDPTPTGQWITKALAQAMTGGDPTEPVVTNLGGSPNAAPCPDVGSISLGWTNPTSGNSTKRIERAPWGTTSWDLVVAEHTASSTSYQDFAVPSNGQWHYRVRVNPDNSWVGTGMIELICIE